MTVNHCAKVWYISWLCQVCQLCVCILVHISRHVGGNLNSSWWMKGILNTGCGSHALTYCTANVHICMGVSLFWMNSPRQVMIIYLRSCLCDCTFKLQLVTRKNFCTTQGESFHSTDVSHLWNGTFWLSTKLFCQTGHWVLFMSHESNESSFLKMQVVTLIWWHKSADSFSADLLEKMSESNIWKSHVSSPSYMYHSVCSDKKCRKKGPSMPGAMSGLPAGDALAWIVGGSSSRPLWL